MILLTALLAASATVPAPQPPTEARSAPSHAGAPARSEAVSVALETRDHLRISGSYFEPARAKGKVPGVILVHDAGSDRKALGSVAAYLAKRGLGALTLDLRGHGESAKEDVSWEGSESDRERETLWAFSVNDLNAAATWLRKRKEIHSAQLVVVGVGSGCALAVRHASGNENVQGVVLIAPSTKNHGFNLREDLEDLEGLPTLTVMGKEKKVDAERLEAAAETDAEQDFMEIALVKAANDKILTDKRIGTIVSKWIKEQFE